MLAFILSLLAGYLIGSVPSGYLLLKWKSNIDIRHVGSGNVGAMNAYEVSGSKRLGIAIMLIDLIKGMVAVTVCWIFSGRNIEVASVAGIASVLGHNYSVWLKGKGGRGLATAAGIMLILGWFFVGVWSLLWIICYFVMAKNILVANLMATILAPAVTLFTPNSFYRIGFPAYAETNQIVFIVSIITILILLGHYKPILELWKSKPQKVTEA